MNINKVIGTCGQGVEVWCLRELTTKHLTGASPRPKESLRGLASLRLEKPLCGFQAFGRSGLIELACRKYVSNS